MCASRYVNQVRESEQNLQIVTRTQAFLPHWSSEWANEPVKLDSKRKNNVVTPLEAIANTAPSQFNTDLNPLLHQIHLSASIWVYNVGIFLWIQKTICVLVPRT